MIEITETLVALLRKYEEMFDRGIGTMQIRNGLEPAAIEARIRRAIDENKPIHGNETSFYARIPRDALI